MNKKKAAAIKKQEDIALSRALLWFALAMVLEFLVLLVDRHYIGFVAGMASFALMMEKVFGVLAVLGIVGGAVCAWWCRKESTKRGELAYGLLVLCVCVFAVGISSALIVLLYSAGVDLLKVVVPALGVLVLVYYLYQKEFFYSALCSGVSLLGLWLVRRGSMNHANLIKLYAVVGIVALVAALVFALQLKKKDGALILKGKRVALLSKQANYLPILLSCVFGILVLAACLLAGSMVAFYLMFALLAWLLVLLVYYTVKLM